jgi:antagonist of KipI
MTNIRVLKPGFFTTVQDLGRPGFAYLGVSAGGAADALSLRIGNLLVGNPGGAASLEMTLLGASLEFDSDMLVAISGAKAECVVRTARGATTGAPLWEAFLVHGGERLECGATTEGARLYLSVAGGLQISKALGSASTLFAGKLGGINGRTLREDDLLAVGKPQCALRRLNRERLATLFGFELRVTRGPQRDWFSRDAVTRFFATEYTVSELANRNGLRLQGDPISLATNRQLLTEGVSLGAVQVPPDGQPIILFVDQQTTGGYPKIANVISADMHRVGQLKPRDVIRFREVSIDDAVEALRAQERWIAESLFA